MKGVRGSWGHGKSKKFQSRDECKVMTLKMLGGNFPWVLAIVAH